VSSILSPTGSAREIARHLDMAFESGIGPSEKVWFMALWEKWALTIEKEYPTRIE